MSGDATALELVTVVDLTSEVSGAYCGKLLADLGARVVLVEPTGGSPLRTRAALFDHLSGGKESVLPTDDADAARLVRALVTGSDVVLLDGSSPWQRMLPTALAPELVVIDLSPFGRSGPHATWRGSDIATWAMGGYCYFTGTPSREPLSIPGSQSGLHAGAHAAFAALVALHERARSGRGQTVELSEVEAVLTAHAWLVSSWAACGLVLPRVESDLVRAADGWVYFMRIAPNPDLFVLIDRPDLAEEDLAADIPKWHANIPRIFAAAAEWAADKTVDDIVDLAQALRVAVTPVLDAEGVSNDPQLEARAWWEADERSSLRFPGQPFKLSATPSRRSGPSPRPGEHTVAARATPARAPAHPAVGSVTTTAPLAGLRVVEVTNNWAGPVAGRFLADLGADVVKVEWATRPATRALFWAGPTQDQQRQGHHRAMYFNELNRNKRGVVIDLSQPLGRDTFLDLVRDADVLIENNSARVMPNLGLDWEHLRAINPLLIMVSMSGYGASGPRRDWVAYGSNIETTSGLTSTTGYRDGLLSRTTLFYADPVSGIHGALAAMAALEHRRRTGTGQWIEMALNECGAAFCAEALLHYSATGEIPLPQGNRSDRSAPQGVYRCIGNDNWVALSVQTDDDWRALAAIIGRPDLAGDTRLGDLAGRRAHHDEIDAAISEWTSTSEQYEVAWALQRAGVSAAPVLANWQMLPDPHLHRRGFFQSIEHPVVGVYPTTTWPWRFSRTPARLERPAPLFSQHNRAILAEIGCDEARIEELYAAGVTSDEPAG